MYSTGISMLIVFITHPGVLFDVFKDSPIIRGFWQAAWATGLQGFSSSSYSTLASMVFSVIAFLALFARIPK
jgi:hypothetical protein